MYQKSTVHRRKRLRLHLLTLAVAGMAANALTPNTSSAQCGYAAGLGCSNTDYTNFGAYSNNDAATIEYDNFISSFHSTIVRDMSGNLKTWGANSQQSGAAHHLTPTIINSANYPVITGTTLKAGLGSRSTDIQSVLLTTNGLYVWGTEGVIVANSLTAATSIQSISLPVGVNATNVKMLFATYHTLALVTCGGDAWVLSQESNNRGNGATGDASTWSQVQTAAGVNLTDVVALRGCPEGLIALTGSGALYTWGTNTYLGNNSAATTRSYATEMTLPSMTASIKMIGASGYNNSGGLISYYVLYTDGNLYCLGENSNRQLGDWSTTDRTAWVQPSYTNGGSVMNNVLWISPNEHDDTYPFINIINTSHNLYNWGMESGADMGRGFTSLTSGNATDPGMPSSLSLTDEILAVESGGHTTMITKKCVENFGYIGHKINGSMGDGTSASGAENNFSYSTAAIQICGVTTIPIIDIVGSTPLLGATGKLCNDQSITLTASPAGGTLALVSGPAALSGNTLTFDGTSGTVIVSYTVTASECSTNDTTITDTFETEGCTIYHISGTVWNDNNGDAIQNGSENGTNTGTPNALWANLINSSGIVVASVPVNSDGTYSLPTTENDTYSIQITNTQIGTGTTASTSITPSVTVLPGIWQYTGTNVSGTPDQTPTNTISNIVVAGAGSAGNNFGIQQDTAPTAVDDSDTTQVNVPLNGDLSTNDICSNSPCTYNPPVTPPTSGGTVTIDPDGSFTYTPPPGFIGVDTFEYAVCDEDGDCDTAVVLITVDGPPVAVNDTATTPVNIPLNGTVVTNDTCGNSPCSYNPIPVTPPTSGGTVIIDPDGSYTYPPPAGFVGTDTFEYAMCDVDGDCDTAVVLIIVDGPPVATDDYETTNINVPVNGNTSTNDVCGNSPCSYNPVPVTPPVNGGSVTINPDGTFTYIPPTDYVGNDTFEYAMCDVDGDCDTAQVVIAIGNLVPVAQDDTYPSNSGNPVNGNVNTNDNDGDGVNVFTLLTDATQGTVVMNPDGSFTYTPSNGYIGPDSFTYSICDVNNDCDTAMVRLGDTDLPVELISFTGKDAGKCVIELIWNTATEDRFSGFDIQHSKDAGNYRKVGEVAAKGNGSSYKYLYPNANDGKNYFRLKMNDLDGSYTYSRVVMVDVSCANGRSISVYPSPTNGDVLIEGIRKGETVQVFDAIGRKMLEVKAAQDNEHIDFAPFADGMYNVVVITGDHEKHNFKVVRK